MSDDRNRHEPSTAEILASIRRIIAEEQAEGGDDVLDLTVTVDDAEHGGEPARPESDGSAADAPDPLVSPAAAAISAAAFASLAGARKGAGAPVGDNQTLEDVVREMLRPMLRQWLDTHLPSIVDRAVRDEISRIARETKGE